MAVCFCSAAVKGWNQCVVRGTPDTAHSFMAEAV